IVQVAAKFLTVHHSLEVPVRRGDDAHVYAVGTTTSETFELLFLQNSEQFGLQCEWHIADFIKEECPFVSQFEAANSLCNCARKSSPFVAKELTLEQIEWNGGTVQLYQGPAAARARIVDRVSDEFLASAGLALDEHSRVRRRNPFGLLKHDSQGRAVAYDLLESADPTVLIHHFHQFDSQGLPTSES
ncbi:MAG TPA: hypothetical protein VJ255_23390, partial [Candidatus Acidoferrum sp.]|nr:hypothetical protein [Candidatus Acidoferrum sp.]